MDKIKTAVIGVGSLGQHHARILSQHENSDLVAVVDASEERGKQIANSWKTVNFTKPEAIINKVQAVVIAVPTPYHYDVAKKFLNAGVHCLIEKPITVEVEHADELIQIAQDKKLILQVGHIERFNPAFTAAQSYIEEPKFIEVTRIGPYDPRMNHIGVILDLMIHDLDILLNIVKSEVISVETYAAKVVSNYEDIAKSRIRFENGCVADVSISRVSMEKSRKMGIFQKDSYVSVDYAAKIVKIYSKRKDIAGLKTLEDVEIIQPEVAPKEPLFCELDHFLQCIKENKQPMVTGVQGRNALKLAHYILNNIKYLD
ncbi:MAG: Gfo/Idh/MocA family oxidoreductase [Endomicrobiaceae bacterium]|nr:Gfo/Idh/MocA family oxidoreductase [Endomicrobiaceae bacterium]